MSGRGPSGLTCINFVVGKAQHRDGSARHGTLAMRNPPQIIAFSVALLLGLGSAGHAETLIQKAVGCLHLETLDRLHQLAQAGGRAALDFMKEQFKSGECSNLSQIGASVRVDQRVKTEVCIVHAGSSEPCRWVPSQVVK